MNCRLSLTLLPISRILPIATHRVNLDHIPRTCWHCLGPLKSGLGHLASIVLPGECWHTAMALVFSLNYVDYILHFFLPPWIVVKLK